MERLSSKFPDDNEAAKRTVSAEKGDRPGGVEDHLRNEGRNRRAAPLRMGRYAQNPKE